MCTTYRFLRSELNFPVALNPRSLSITDAWGYYKGSVYFHDSVGSGLLRPSKENQDTGQDTSGGEGQDISGEGRDTSGEGQDTSDEDQDTSSEGQDASGKGRDTSGEGQDTTGGDFSCNSSNFKPSVFDPRRDEVKIFIGRQ